MKKLDVVFRGWGQRWVLGTLADNGTELLFEYSPEALRRGVEFSRLHLPLRSQAFSGFAAHQGSLPGLVSDALPDGWGLLLMDKLFLRSGKDPSLMSPLDRLAFIGDRAMGALAFEPSGDLALTDADLSLLDLARAAQDVIQGKDTNALKALALVGGSPHGARPKVLLQFDAPTRMLSTREDAPGEPWLLKFPAQGEHAEVCAVEYAYSGMARSCGIDMPPTIHFRNDTQLAAFAVQRFDRERGMRVPVHSFAGALNADFRLPSLDYRDVLRATRFFTGDEQEVCKAFARCVFNVVFHNRDDHAKNFALRMNERMEWKLAPAYDLSFNAGPRGQHQTAVMGEGLLPGRQELLALAKNCDVPAQFAVELVDRVCEAAAKLPEALDAAGVRRATRKLIVDAVQTNLKRCSVQVGIASGLHGPQDLQSLLLHKAAVRLILQDPSLVARARATLERWREQGDPRTMPLWDEWLRILEHGDWTKALANTQRGRQLRQASPLATLLPEETRLRILAEARAM